MKALRLLLPLALVAVLGLTSSAQAQNGKRFGLERYRAKAGDTLELIAAEYYGNRVHKIYIMVENGIDHERPLKKGERLRIPVSSTVTTAVGDTLADLAATYLGDPDRGEYLAEFNNLDQKATLSAGQEITIPMQVSYRARGDISLQNIALSLFADGSKAKLLRNYNGLDGDALRNGQRIMVPVPTVKVQAAKRRPQDAKSSERAAKRRTMMERARSAVPEARAYWRDGNFGRARGALTTLELDYLSTEMAVQVGVLLGAIHVAFDDEDLAMAAFGRVLARAPKHSLDPAEHSPKVRRVWELAREARGQ